MACRGAFSRILESFIKKKRKSVCCNCHHNLSHNFFTRAVLALLIEENPFLLFNTCQHQLKMDRMTKWFFLKHSDWQHYYEVGPWAIILPLLWLTKNQLHFQLSIFGLLQKGSEICSCIAHHLYDFWLLGGTRLKDGHYHF